MTAIRRAAALLRIPRGLATPPRHTSLVALAALTVLSVAGCVHHIPLPKALEVASTAELRGRIEAARTPVQRYFAEARLTYFGPEGRMKGSATLAVSRPKSLRYDATGPNGSVVEAFATDGVELELLAAAESRFFYGPASVANVDRLMAFAPMHLDAGGWVALLFGEAAVPEDAGLRYDDLLGCFVLSWNESGTVVEARVDPATSRLVGGRLSRDGHVVSEMGIEKRDARGLPSELRLRVPEAGMDVRVTLRDVDYDPTMEAKVFHLDAPNGVVPERLGP